MLLKELIFNNFPFARPHGVAAAQGINRVEHERFETKLARGSPWKGALGVNRFTMMLG